MGPGHSYLFILSSLGRPIGQVAQEEWVVGDGSQGTGDSDPAGEMPAGFVHWADVAPL